MKYQERFIYVISILILIFLLLKSCVSNSNTQLQYTKLNDENQKFKVQHYRDSTKLYSMSANYASQLEIANRKSMALSILKLRKPKQITKIIYTNNLKTQIPLEKPILLDSTLYLKLPQSFSQTQKWFTIDGIINTKGVLQIDSLKTKGIFTYGIGDTLRNGFFNRLLRKKDQVVRVHIDNPYMEIINMDNIILKHDKKWYQTTAFKIAVGCFVGFSVAKKVK